MLENYGTLSETIQALMKEGYTLDFNIGNSCLVCNHTKNEFSPDQFVIDKIYRFEGVSNPDDQSILYAISSETLGVKGVLVNGYGISADEDTNDLIAKLETHPN
jgi:glutamine synthetase type III